MKLRLWVQGAMMTLIGFLAGTVLLNVFHL